MAHLLTHVLFVALGGGLGASARYLTNLAALRALGPQFPWGTITVNILGEPDNGVIAASYLGSLLMAGGFLAIGSCMSAVTKNQVIAFILSVVVGLMFILSGFQMILGPLSAWTPHFILETVSSFSFLTHFHAISKGVLDLRDIFFFLTLIAFWLFATAAIIDMKKAE